MKVAGDGACSLPFSELGPEYSIKHKKNEHIIIIIVQFYVIKQAKAQFDQLEV